MNANDIVAILFENGDLTNNHEIIMRHKKSKNKIKEFITRKYVEEKIRKADHDNEKKFWRFWKDCPTLYTTNKQGE